MGSYHLVYVKTAYSMLEESRAGCKDEGGAAASIMSSLSSLVLILQLIMNVANSNNQRKNENNNNNVNERVNVLLNEYENEVTAMGMSPGRSLFTDDDFEDLEEYWKTWRADVNDETSNANKELLIPRLYFQAFKEILVLRSFKTEKM